jgi:hypothetical protein
VRKFAAGEFARQSQELLNELARAMLCLTDANRKGEYDASLGRKDTGTGKRRTFEQILLATKVVEQAAIDKARNFAKAINVEVRDALVQQKLARYDAVLPAYAESIGLPYLDLTDIPLDPSLIAAVPAFMARQHSCVPVMVDAGQLLMASPNPIDPNVEEELRLRFSMPVRTVLCTPANINDVIAKHVPRDASAAPAPAPVAAAPAAAPVAAAPAAAPAAKAPSGPLTPEQKKQRLTLTFIFAGQTFIVSMLVFYQFLGWGFWTTFLATFPLALVVAGIAWVV